jgi:hypothetical protein
MYRITSAGQPTSGGPPVWGLDMGLIIVHRKTQHVMKCYTGPELGGYCEYCDKIF